MTWESTQHEWSGDGEEPYWLEHIERLANAFASHILLPAAEVESQYEARYRGGQISYPDLVDMAREFEVSTEALVWRLRLAGRLTQKEAEQILGDPEFREADRRTMPSHWTMAPAGALPQRYWRLALGAYRRGEVSLGRLATILEVSVSEVGALVFGENDEQEAATAPA